MKILCTGGGSGGHFYPIIAIAQAIREVVKQEHLIGVELYYMSPTPYNQGILFDNNITYIKNSAGKMRRYFSLLNLVDSFKTAWGVVTSVWKIFNLYPDVVFGKGGYASFPALLAARLLRIPVVIHESDTAPGRVNKWAGKFARRIAISYPQAAEHFPTDKVAFTGQPIQKELLTPLAEGAHEYLKLDPNIPTILILGGSQGATALNDAILDALPRLVEKYQIIHQTGKNNLAEVTRTADLVLAKSLHRERHQAFAYLNNLAMRMAAGISTVIISRAGSTIFEIAAWGVPSVIVPITDSNANHQVKNAYAYASSGAAVVIEEKNLTANIMVSEINRLMENNDIREQMKRGANEFIKRDAATLIAREILKLGLTH